MTRLHRVILSAVAAVALAVGTACSGPSPAGSGTAPPPGKSTEQLGPITLHHDTSQPGALRYFVTWP